MHADVKLGLNFLLRGKIVLLEGPGHPSVLEALADAWQKATVESVILTREGRTQEFFSSGGSYLVQDMVRFWQGDLFEEKQKLGDSARDVSLLAISHLGVELPNNYRKEAIRLLLKERVDRITSAAAAVAFPKYCAILGVEAVGTLRARYGDDLASAVGAAGISIETP
jgi:hypothetical protein